MVRASCRESGEMSRFEGGLGAWLLSALCSPVPTRRTEPARLPGWTGTAQARARTLVRARVAINTGRFFTLWTMAQTECGQSVLRPTNQFSKF